MEFSEKLNELLKKNNMSQADLCKKTGIASSLMANYCSGKKSPALSNSVAIADALEITLDELVGKESPGTSIIGVKVGENIKKRRVELNRTLEEIENIVGITKQTICKYENNIITNIPSDKLEKIAQALNVSPAYLMGWTEKQLSSPGISRETGRYVNQTTPTQLEKLTTYLKEDDKEPTLEVLIDILKSMPEKSYSEIKDNLMVIKFKYHLKEGE